MKKLCMQLLYLMCDCSQKMLSIAKQFRIQATVLYVFSSSLCSVLDVRSAFHIPVLASLAGLRQMQNNCTLHVIIYYKVCFSATCLIWYAESWNLVFHL